MTQQIPVIYDAKNSVHTTLNIADTITPTSIPTSSRKQNLLQTLSDGLYVGNTLAAPIFYVSSLSGTDATTSGSITTPYASLDYALIQIAATNTTSNFSGITSIELKSGEAFTLNNDFIIDRGQLSFGFYAEPTYGATSSMVGTTMAKAWSVNTVLVRPTLSNVSTLVGNYWNCSKFLLRNEGRLIFKGVNIQLPDAPTNGLPANNYGMYTDLIAVENHHKASATIEGCIVNKNDVTSFYGLAGVQARCDGLTFSQFASQFQIGSVIVINGATSQTLLSRATFLKFYADYAGNNQINSSLVPSNTTSSPGSGIMRINWSDTSVQFITPTVQNLGTYPLLADVNYGLTNYFTGLTRDQQSRAQNVQSGRTF